MLPNFFHTQHLTITHNNLLTGFIMFALNPDNKDHPILKEFKELGKRPKLPSKSR